MPDYRLVDGGGQYFPTAVTVTKRVVDPINIPAAEADVWDPGLASSIYLDVEFEITNVDGTNDVTVDLGIDINDDSGASDYYFLVDYVLAAASIPIRLGPYRIGGNDAIRASASAANDAVLHVYVLDEGDAT